MDGGGTTTNNTTTSSAPWSGSQPYLSDVMSQGQNLFDSSMQNSTQYAPFNTVVQPGATTQQGLDLTAQRALDGSPVTNAANQNVTNLLQSQTPPPGNATLQSLLGYQNPAMAQAGQLAQNGPNLSGNSTLQNIAQGGGQNPATGLAAMQAMQNPYANPSQANLESMARGADINPYLNSLYGAASKPVIDSVNSQFAAGGRTGSGANQQLLTRDLGDLSSNIFSTGYQNAINNQLNANNQVQGAFDSGAGRNLSATGLLGQFGEQNTANQLTAAQGLNSSNIAGYGAQGNATSLLGNLGQAQAGTQGNAANSLNSANIAQQGQQLNAAQLAPSLANNDYTDLQNLLNVGGAQDSQSAANIQDMLTRWQYQQQQPWNLLNNYSGLVTGYAGLGGTANGTSTQTQPSQSLIPSLIGGAVSLATKSDRRAKTDIRRIGTYPNGLPMYSFQYKSDRRKHHVGVMAQDVIKVRPEAVVMRPDGYMAVNYPLALAA